MSETKWPPGPWTNLHDTWIVARAGETVVMGTMSKGTADLIAAAPLMAEALAPFAALDQPELVRRADSDPLYGVGTGDAITVGDVRRAVAALRAARGETP